MDRHAFELNFVIKLMILESSADDRFFASVAVYVFLGDYHALMDFVRYMHSKDMNGQLKKSEYVVIAVKDTAYDHKHRQKYLKKCKKILKHDGHLNTVPMHFYIRVVTKSIYGHWPCSLT